MESEEILGIDFHDAIMGLKRAVGMKRLELRSPLTIRALDRVRRCGRKGQSVNCRSGSPRCCPRLYRHASRPGHALKIKGPSLLEDALHDWSLELTDRHEIPVATSTRTEPHPSMSALSEISARRESVTPLNLRGGWFNRELVEVDIAP